jgi:protein-disulfide isomerase
MQGKYEAFHFELMENPGDLSERHLRAIAGRVGVDAERMVEDMQSGEVDEAIRRNHQLARRLRLTGTPALYVGPFFQPGAIELEQLRDLVVLARQQPS